MTPVNDNSRTFIGGKPAWLEAPTITIPSLLLVPEGPGLWRVQFMFPDPAKSYSFSWVGKQFAQGPELDDFLTAWEASPEETVRGYFYLEPPNGKVWNFAKSPEIAGEIETDLSLEELGL